MKKTTGTQLRFVDERPPHNIYDYAKPPITASLSVTSEKLRDCLQMNKTHRMEFVGDHRGIRFINDSRCSNVNQLWYSLETVGKDVVLIMGGMDRGNDYSSVLDLVKDKVKAIVCIGKDNSNIKLAFNKVVSVFEAETMTDAMDLSLSIAKRGDTVLLSPACASFDRYKDYEDRGNQFKEAVKYYS